VSDLIKKANHAYYNQGEPILTDAEFDLIIDHGLATSTSGFRKKVTLPVPMGSLKKATDPDSLRLLAGNHKVFAATPKVDGNSVLIAYRGGELVLAATRGDGIIGNEITDKVKAAGTIPLRLPTPLSIIVRAEAALPKAEQARNEKNIRNILAGMLNEKELDAEGMKKVRFIVFDFFTRDATTFYGQRQGIIKKLFPDTAPFVGFDSPTYAELEALYRLWAESYPFFIDGVVLEKISDDDRIIPAKAKDLIPDNKWAVKFKKDAVETVVEGVEWTLGMHQRLAPVLLIKPVDVDGATIKRVSASNAALLLEAGMGVGAKVGVVKSGDIIPFVQEVLERSTTLPEVHCNDCGAKADWDNDGVHFICPNPDCTGKGLVRLHNIFRILELDGWADTTIERFYRAGFNTFAKLYKASAAMLATVPGMGAGSAKKLHDVLHARPILYSEMIACAGLFGIGRRQSDKLLAAFGDDIDAVMAAIEREDRAALSRAEAFGEGRVDVLINGKAILKETLAEMGGLGMTVKDKVRGSAGKMVVVTGAAPGMTRAQLEAALESKGWVMKSAVGPGVAVVVTADPGSNSTKMKAARAKGIPIKSYDDFFAEVGIEVAG
jgi:DNA ligase (NAD+)